MGCVASNASIISFSALDKTGLYGMLIKPKRKTDIAVLHIHGLGGSFYGSSAMPYFAREAYASGFAFFSIQTRGSYVIERYNYSGRNRKGSFMAGGALERFEDCVYDIGGAVKELSKQGYKKIFLEGHSTGCQKILYYVSSPASKKSAGLIAGIALLSPVDDHNYDRKAYGKRWDGMVKEARMLDKRNILLMPDKIAGEGQNIIGVKRFLSTAVSSMPESMALDYRSKKMDFIRAVKKPMAIIFGAKDPLMTDTPVGKAMKKIETEYTGPMLSCSVIKGADHSFHNGKAALAAKKAFGFYKEALSLRKQS